MSDIPNSRGARSSQRLQASTGSRSRRRRRELTLESLEGRTLLTYTFTFGGANGPQTVNESGGSDSFTVVNNGFGLLEWSPDPATTPFSTQWGPNSANTLNASPAVTMTINQTGNYANVIVGTSSIGSTATSSASAVQARIVLNPNPGLNGSALTIDDSESTLGDGTYALSASGVTSTITGPLDDINITSNLGMTGGATILGSDSDDVYNMTAVSSYQSTSIVGGSGVNTVNAGTGTSVGGILASLSVIDPTGTATLNVNDSADTSSSTATLSGTTPYELTGLSGGAIMYGAGVTALNITGGTSEESGVTFDINNTQSITTTTITGGAGQNFFNLSNSEESNGLDNLPGPVSILGGSSFTDVVTLDDSSAGFDDSYSITPTTVSRTVFGGLTYDDNIGTLTLNAENTLNSETPTGNNTINIDSTADFITTNINGQGGNDLINVNSTGTLGVLNVSTGTDGSTVNVVADTEPVNLNLNGNEVVNIGSTGGAGTMAGILSPINISDIPALYTLTFHDENDTTGHTWTLDNVDSTGPFGTASMALDGNLATTTYKPGDLNSPLTVDAGSGGNTFNVNNTTSNVETDLNTGSGNDTVNVLATGNNLLAVNGEDGTDTVTLGGVAGVGTQSLSGTIHVSNTLGFSSLNLDDSQDATGRTVLMSDDGTTGTITGLAPATINDTDADISSLTVLGGSGGNSFTVQGTLVNADYPATLTTLNTGSGGPNTIDVLATDTGSVLNLVGTGSPDYITIGDGTLGTILGQVNVDELPATTRMVIDLSNDALSHNLNLSSDGTTGTLSDTLGNLPQNITYTVSGLNSLEIDTDPTQDETLNVSFAGGGNPIPIAATPGLIFNAGDPMSGAIHALTITGELENGPLTNETHNADDSTVSPKVGQYGSIDLTENPGDSDLPGTLSSIDYTGLQSITDSTPATLYTFNDFGLPDQSFIASVPGTLLPGALEFASTPTPSSPLNFGMTDILNKSHVVFNTPTYFPGLPGEGVSGVVDIPTASAGLLSLTFNVSTGNNNTVDFVATPAGVVTTLNGSTAQDTSNLTGESVAVGTTLVLHGGPGQNTLNYDADGMTPTVTAGTNPGEVIISLPGFGTIDATSFQAVDITNVKTPTILAGPARSMTSIEGAEVNSAVIGTFTMVIPAIIANQAGMPASDFTAGINWGDPAPDAQAGTVTQDASDPSLYYITGTHTFALPGDYAVSNIINFTGATYASTLNGSVVSVTLNPEDPTTGNSASATVVAAQPTIIGVSPNSGPSAGGTLVTITGIDFTGATAVDFGNTPGTGFTVVNATTITVNDPAGTGVVDVTVATTGGTSATSPSDLFTYVAPAPITGTVYLDLNAGGTIDPTDPGLAGRVVFLDLNHDGTLDPGDPSATTDANGNFSLIGTPTGAVVVLEDTSQDSTDRYVVDQTTTNTDGTLSIGVVPISPVAPVLVVPNPFSATPSTDPDTAYVESLYLAVLGRSGSDSEVAGWLADIQGGMTHQQVAASFINAPEHRQDEVNDYYEEFLNRATDPGSVVWVNDLLAGASEESVVEGILDSPEYQDAHQDSTQFIQDLYTDVLGRQGGTAGLASWQAALASGTSRVSIVADFVQSPEAVDQVVDSFYTSYLHRQPEQLTSNLWVTMLEAPNGSASDVAIGILSSAEFDLKAMSPQT